MKLGDHESSTVLETIQYGRDVFKAANRMSKSDKETVAVGNILTCINAYLYDLEKHDGQRIVRECAD